MASPSDLVAHYSTRAFLTRIAALTFVGAVVGATLHDLRNREISSVVGFTLIVIVLSLAELNRRYTHSYLAACRAASAEIGDPAEARRWRLFTEINEDQWRKNTLRRFLLNWLTYFPGLLLGEYLVVRWGFDAATCIALMLGTLIVIVWGLASRKPIAASPPESRRAP